MWAALALLVLVLLLVALVAIAPFEGRPAPEEAEGPWAYLTVFALVFGDAVIPILPGETTSTPRRRWPRRDSSSSAG